MRKTADVLEAVVVVAILLVLVHTFLDDASILAGAGVRTRAALIWTGLAFDVFFTVEFLVRMYLALASRQGIEYFFRQRGWIDFLASIPLLLLNSLPHALALLAGAGLLSGLGSFLNVLKVIKAVRIARILRLLRVVKLFRSIRYARSPMAQGHVSTITTIAVSILVLWTLAASAMEAAGVIPGLETPFVNGQAQRAAAISAAGAGTPALAQRAAAVAALDPTILVVRPVGGPVVWSRYPGTFYAERFLPGDYGYYVDKGVEVFTDERPLSMASAREGLVFFVAVVLTVLAFLFVYAPRFAMQISDPIHVMRRGMAESDYNLEVLIPPGRATDDVFELASLYNTVFLPMKDRAGAGDTGAGGALGIEDLKDLAGKG
jgi:hypothetical protein